MSRALPEVVKDLVLLARADHSGHVELSRELAGRGEREKGGKRGKGKGERR